MIFKSREIESGEFSEVFGGGIVISLGGFFLGREGTEILNLVVNTNLGTPGGLGLLGNAFEPGSVVRGQPFIPAVLLMRANAEVLAPVVQRISVDVIDNLARLGVRDQPVELVDAAFVAGHCVDIGSGLVSRNPDDPPPVAVQGERIVIDDCFESPCQSYPLHFFGL